MSNGIREVLVRVVPRVDAIEIGGAVAHEQPAFDYVSFSIGYRRVF